MAVGRRLTRAGLTFVELVIAATMMSVLFVGLGSHLRGGITVWQRATTISEQLQQQRVALERLQRDLADAFVYSQEQAYGPPPKLPAPLFEPDQLRWFTRQQATTTRPPGVRIVDYRCETRDGVQGLWRTSWSISEARSETFLPTPELLLPGCDALSARYAYLPPAGAPPTPPFEWHDRWNEPKQLPPLIALSLEGARMAIQQWLSIPAGMMKPFETPP